MVRTDYGDHFVAVWKFVQGSGEFASVQRIGRRLPTAAHTRVAPTVVQYDPLWSPDHSSPPSGSSTENLYALRPLRVR